ncbi:MAG: inositol polyphosphate kinase family protein [Pseudomonadota bacterium]
MKSYTDKNQEKTKRVADGISMPKHTGEAAIQCVDNRTAAVAQHEMAEAINTSPKQAAQGQQLHSLFGNTAQMQPLAEDKLQMKTASNVMQKTGPEKDELLQGEFGTAPIQREPNAKPNNTGLPDNLKAGIENLSGFSMEDVKVHYNSPKPFQLQAHAYAQGTDIHVAPGQEQHLPHESWHVVQQKQGRVKSTKQLKGNVYVNDDSGLEKEADIMGAKAYQSPKSLSSENVNRSKSTANVVNPGNTVQMAGHSGVMIFSNNGRLLKRVEINEAKQFTRIMEKQNDDNVAISTPALSTFPMIYRVEEKVFGTVGGLLKGNYNEQGDDEKKWVKKHENGDSYVEMESLGGVGIDVLDFKIGTVTAHSPELQGNYGKTEENANEKVRRMASVDTNSETAEFGLRDSDNLKNNLRKGFARWRGNFRSTLDAVDQRLKVSGPYPDDAQVFQDLESIHAYLAASNVVYIASSLVMKWTTDRARSNEDKIVLIDLAHPVPEGMEGFEEIKAGMLLGIMNLHAMLGGEERSADWDSFEEE